MLALFLLSIPYIKRTFKCSKLSVFGAHLGITPRPRSTMSGFVAECAAGEGEASPGERAVPGTQTEALPPGGVLTTGASRSEGESGEEDEVHGRRQRGWHRLRVRPRSRLCTPTFTTGRRCMVICRSCAL